VQIICKLVCDYFGSPLDAVMYRVAVLPPSPNYR